MAGRRVADQLLKAGADPNQETSLLPASCDWHFEHLLPGLRYLTESAWDVNSLDSSGQTALHKAAFLGYAKAVRALMELGADPASRDFSGLTPVDVARRGNKPAAIKALARAA